MGMLTSSAHLQRFTEALLRAFSRFKMLQQSGMLTILPLTLLEMSRLMKYLLGWFSAPWKLAS